MEENENSAKQGLTIDYSKFQTNFLNKNSISLNNNLELNNKEANKENRQNKNEVQKYKNLDQFLNVSGILYKNESQTSFLDNLT